MSRDLLTYIDRTVRHSAPPTMAEAGRVDPYFPVGRTPHLLRRCYSAARLELRDCKADVGDCGMDIYLSTLEEARAERLGASSGEHGSAADVLAYMDRAAVAGDRADWPREERCTLTLLRLRARQWRRDKQDRRMAELGERPPTDIGSAPLWGTTEPEPIPRGLPPAAAERAAEWMASCLGVEGRAVTTALYVLLRDISTDHAADELGVQVITLRPQVSRGYKQLRAVCPTPRELLAALNLLDPPAADARKRTHMLAKGERVRPDTVAPCISRPLIPAAA